jgi:small-conductance mechanosensitive channel
LDTSKIDIESFATIALQWIFDHGIRIVVILLLTFVTLLIARWITGRILAAMKSEGADSERVKRADTLNSIIRYALRVVILTIATVVILGELGIEIGPILAAAGIVGLAVGFGAQQLVQDVISGFFILMEDQIRVGDVVNVSGKGGVVEQVSLRMIVLRDLAGNVHYIRNGQIDVITNMTKEFSQYVFDIGVAYREDTDEVSEIIRQVGEELKKDPEYAPDILDSIEILGVDQFADSAVVIKARIKTRPIKQWRVGREFNRRLKKAFDARNIEIPFPHLTVYMGEGKQGGAPPLFVRTSEQETG